MSQTAKEPEWTYAPEAEPWRAACLTTEQAKTIGKMLGLTEPVTAVTLRLPVEGTCSLTLEVSLSQTALLRVLSSAGTDQSGSEKS